jgi:ArsR family transcriptional regulator
MEDKACDLRAELLKALASPLRLRILDALRDGEKNVCELMDALGACQSTVSCHLGVLRTSGLVLDRREGTSVYYRVGDERVYALMGTLDEVLRDQCEEIRKALEEL